MRFATHDPRSTSLVLCVLSWGYTTYEYRPRWCSVSVLCWLIIRTQLMRLLGRALPKASIHMDTRIHPHDRGELLVLTITLTHAYLTRPPLPRLHRTDLVHSYDLLGSKHFQAFAICSRTPDRKIHLPCPKCRLTSIDRIRVYFRSIPLPITCHSCPAIES